jgi:hypothetical protein
MLAGVMTNKRFWFWLETLHPRESAKSFDELLAVGGTELSYASMGSGVDDTEKSATGAVTICKLFAFRADNTSTDDAHLLTQRDSYFFPHWVLIMHVSHNSIPHLFKNQPSFIS